MNTRILVILSVLCASSLAAQTVPQYTVELNPVTFPGIPALHSFARAVGPKGQWLIVSGRTNGLHTFPRSSGTNPPANAFPPQQANANLWVIDPAAQKAYPPAPVPATPLGDSLTVTNALSYQDGDTLYIVGGYGNQTSTQTMITFPTITAIPVSATIHAIMNGKPLPPFTQVSEWYDCVDAASSAFNTCVGPRQKNCLPGPLWQTCMQQAQTTCSAHQASTLASCNTAILSGSASAAETYHSNTGPYYAAVAGGGMEKIGSIFWLVFGQNFQGLYSRNPGDYGRWPTQQIYAERFTALWIGDLGGKLSGAVLNVLQQDPNTTQWHRRDLNVVPALDTDGSPMITAYGGVFVPGKIAPFDQPIHLKNGTSALHADAELDPYHQLFSQYECATLKMWSTSAKSMQTIFFGGIGLYYISTNNGTLQKDTGLPFVNTLSVLTRASNGASSEVYAAMPLPSYMGANATFIPSPKAPLQSGSGEIIALDQITEKKLVGWIYGGILSSQTQPPNGGTTASNAIYEVWLTPGVPPAGFWNSVTESDTSVLR